MTPQTFRNKLMAHKEKAHILLEENVDDYIIRRGMGHVMSGYVEDLFAVYLSHNLKHRHVTYLVDKVVSHKPGPERAKSFKPDLLIYDGTVAYKYFDLKTDLGYNREFVDYMAEKNDFILSLRGKTVWETYNNTRNVFTMHPEITYDIVVTFDWNINEDILKQNLEEAKNFPGIRTYVLLNKIESEIIPNEREFSRLLNDCSTIPVI